jgi:hypothetical protein
MSWFWLMGLTSRAVFERKRDEMLVSGAVSTWSRPTAAIAGSVTASTSSQTQEQLSIWPQKLDSLSNLALGWDRHCAPAPSEQAIRAARQLIEAMVNDAQPPTRVAASAVGGVGVTRRVGERMAYVEFYNDGASCALLADDAGDERVLEIEPGSGSFRDLLDTVNTYLNG